jgi:hypothetical protein
MKQSTPTSKEDTANRLVEDTVHIFPIDRRSTDCQVFITHFEDEERWKTDCRSEFTAYQTRSGHVPMPGGEEA